MNIEVMKSIILNIAQQLDKLSSEITASANDAITPVSEGGEKDE